MRRRHNQIQDEDEEEQEMQESEIEEEVDEEDEENQEEENIEQIASQTQQRTKRVAMKDGYLPGSIVRVRLQNFVTYDAVEFSPGPHLNMIIGPNGTGKSTIVCAIALGLGWNPAVLGRAKDVASFVKQGTAEGLIELELKSENEDQPNLVIQRQLRKQDNISKWFINGRSATSKDVKNAVDEFHIDVGNLCCFLPQDRVAEFANMKPDELLMQTQSAAGDPRMPGWHQYLMANGKEQIRYQNMLEEEEKQAVQVAERLEYLQRDVDRAIERREMEEKVELLKVLLLEAQYNEKNSLYNTLKAEKQKRQQELAKIEQHLQPLADRLHSLTKDTEKKHTETKNMQAEFKRDKNALQKDRDELEKLENDSQKVVEELDSLVTRDKETKRHIDQLQRAISELREQLKDHPSAPDTTRVDNEMRQLRATLDQIRNEDGELNIEYDSIRNDISKINQETEGLRNKLTRLDSVKEARLQMLSKADHHTYKAVLWLRENAHMFHGKIYEPVMLELSIRNPAMTSAVESCISFAVMKTFVCELQEDYDLFGRLMERQGLRVNFCDRGNAKQLHEFRRPLAQAELEALGFDNYVIDLIDGPDIILRYLCNDVQLQSIPVAMNERNVDIESVERDRYFSRFITGQSQHSISYSQYGSRQAQTLTRDLKPARTFNHSIDQNERNRLDRRLHEIKEQMKEFEIRGSRISEEKENLKRRKEQVRQRYAALEQEKGKALEAINRYERVKVDLRTKETALEKERSRPTKELEKQELQAKLNAINDKSFKVVEKMSAMVIQQVKKHDDLDMKLLQLLHDQQKKEELRRLKGNNEMRCNDAKEVFNSAAERTDKAKDEARRALQSLRESIAVVSEITRDKFKEQRNSRSSGNIESTESSDELQRQLNTEEAKLAMVMNVQPGIMDDYESRKREQRQVEERIQKYKKEKRKIDNKVEKVSSLWIPALETLVKSVDQRFSRAFQAIGNAGEVSIIRDADYEKWGIAIKVKFRAQEELQQLDAQRQSGGERSISTITYLLSLTEMSSAPFSLVDEINQGMDQKYERQVHNHMVKVTCENAVGQYFLITPKLLPNLTYHERMRVLIINNGDWLPERLNLKRYIAPSDNGASKKARLNGHSNTNGRSIAVA